MKSKKKLMQGNASDPNGEDLESDSGVSTADGITKSSIPNVLSSRKRKFSKTAKVIDQVVEDEESGDLVATEGNERLPIENTAKAKLGEIKKRQSLKKNKLGSGETLVNPEKPVSRDKQVNRRKVVTQEKLVNGEKLVRQVNGCEEKKEKLSDSDREETMNISNARKVNGGKGKAAKSVKSVSDEEKFESTEDDETCTEEEEEQQGEEKDNRAREKQRNKLLKKVKVSLRRYFHLIFFITESRSELNIMYLKQEKHRPFRIYM